MLCHTSHNNEPQIYCLTLEPGFQLRFPWKKLREARSCIDYFNGEAATSEGDGKKKKTANDSAPQNHRDYALVLASSLETDIIVLGVDDKQAILYFSPKTRTWVRIHFKMLHNMIADKILETFSKRRFTNGSWEVCRGRSYLKQKGFTDSVGSETLAMLMQADTEAPSFDSEATRRYLVFKCGTCCDFETGTMCKARRSMYITKYVPWAYTRHPLTDDFIKLADMVHAYFKKGGVELTEATTMTICTTLQHLRKSSPTLQLLFDVYKDWGVVIWVVRLFASAISADASKTMFTYLFGPGGSGKDTVVMLMTALLGTGKNNLTRFLKKTFFIKEQDPESASPFLVSLVAARWVVVTEVPAKPILGDNLKDVTEPQGAELIARPLYGPPVSFHPFFRLVIMSNHEFKVEEEDDSGVWRRDTRLTHSQLFKATPTETHHSKANPKVKGAIKRGDYAMETFALAFAFVSGLGVVEGDVILPMPEKMGVAVSEKMDSKGFEFEKVFEKCKVSESMKADAVRAFLTGAPLSIAEKKTASWLLEHGFSKRKASKVNGGHYYYYILDKGGFECPVRVKQPAAQPAGDNSAEAV